MRTHFCAALILLVSFTFTSLADQPRVSGQSATTGGQSRNQQAVTGPRETMNQAIAAGATVIVSMKPVPPKTVPPSSYPMGTVIMNETIFLPSATPTRVWLELRVTGWAPECARLLQVKIDATDEDMDGGGYDGDDASCDAAAGDLFPAIVPCNGVCNANSGPFAGMNCNVNSDCGNPPGGGQCRFDAATAPNGNLACRAALTGRTTPCGQGEPSVCIPRPSYFPPGSGNVCSNGFQDQCHPQIATDGVINFNVVDTSTLNNRLCFFVGSPDDCATDFHPSYVADLVLDVPANAKGDYRIDFNESETFMQSQGSFPDNDIPIALLNVATISVPCCDCDSASDCADNDACTMDICDQCVCTNAPVAGWDPATECCNPANAAQGAIPQSSPCRTGGCSLGGSSGTPTLTSVPNGTACQSTDPCFSDGQCISGQCAGQQYAGSNCPKPRFISFDISTGAASSAYRVRLVSLHHPNPPYAGVAAADFSAFEGQYRWIGVPDTYSESSANPTPVYAAMVGCDPHYQDWSGIDLLHVNGAEIVPSSEYEVQSIAEGLDTNVESNFSAPITVMTSRWGDVVIPYNPPSATTQPDAGDHAALVDKFRSIPAAISKPRGLIVGSDAAGVPTLDSDVSFEDIAASVDAYEGRPYPYSGPIACP